MNFSAYYDAVISIPIKTSYVKPLLSKLMKYVRLILQAFIIVNKTKVDYIDIIGNDCTVKGKFLGTPCFVNGGSLPTFPLLNISFFKRTIYNHEYFRGFEYLFFENETGLSLLILDKNCSLQIVSTFRYEHPPVSFFKQISLIFFIYFGEKTIILFHYFNNFFLLFQII